MGLTKILKLLALIVTIFVSVSCGTTREINRVSPEKDIDLSGRWNDVDSRQTAEAMIQQLLGDKWIPGFEQSNEGKKPIVIVGLVNNKSHEHIDAETFIKDLEKAIIKMGSVRLVQAGDKREELRGERAGQQEFASKETAKKWGKELGADFMLQGTINSIVDTYNNEKVVYYQIDLELSNLETNEMVWMGDKKIKKYIKN
ncbi:MAG: penicillin-binding protein activator LpoB [Bacteroidetes bacterium GWE2_29_8]|nr:MAG: penicillin-binding protein activator LpoB [Bacteroidetes bacterium GWE2_29_8]OFY22585.1 MAG: penicillin-binding protein activator LpoB [Bacteroidetes bacterium GWF2_29_10]